jgi:hypothetical protein
MTALTATAAERPQETGTLLELREDDMFNNEPVLGFNPHWVYVCVRVKDQILIGKNLENIFSYDWTKLEPFEGKRVNVSYDKNSISIQRPDSKYFRLSQSYSSTGFRNMDCNVEVARHLIVTIPHSSRPLGVPSGAIFVPFNSRLWFWMKCDEASDTSPIRCEIYRKNGEVEDSSIFVPLQEGLRVAQDSLVIDPLRSSSLQRLVLADGTVIVRDTSVATFREHEAHGTQNKTP